MKIRETVIVLASAVVTLFAVTGCDSPDAGSGAAGGAFWGGVVGQALGAAGVPVATVNAVQASMVVAGAVMGQINADQRRQLQAQSPQTLEVIERNDAVANGQSSQEVLPLTVDNIEALISVGVKPDVIVAEIKASHTRYSDQDVAKVLQAYPGVDASITQTMSANS